MTEPKRTLHVLKTWPVYYAAIADGRKTFEVRKDDRAFQTGDTVQLREWDPDKCQRGRCKDPDCPAYTGREVVATIGYVLHSCQAHDFGDSVVFSLLNVTPPSPNDGGAVA